MKAFLINPFEKSITEVEHNGDYKEIYKLCDYDTFTVVPLEDNDSIFVDDEGLLKTIPENGFFAVPSLHDYQAFVGKGLVLGCDDNGDSTAPKISLDELKKIVTFPSIEDVLAGKYE
jgi:hypothetical protein